MQHDASVKKPDFEALFRTSPYPYLVMDTELVIIGANDAYLRSTGRTEEDIVGHYIFDAFPTNPDDPDSTNVTEVKKSLEKAIATGMPDTTPFLRYAVPKMGTDGKTFDERYWSTVHTPVFGPDGTVTGVVQNAIDVTELYSFNKASKVASVEKKLKSASSAENFNRAQMHEAMTRILNDERGHLRNLFNQAPGFIAVLSGPNHVFEMVNEAYYQVVGHRDILGKPVMEALPEVAGQGFEELLDNVFATGKAFVGRGIKALLQREAGAPSSEIYMDLVYEPMFASDGTASGIFVQGHDVTDAYLAQSAKRESDERLEEGMLAAQMVVWDWDVTTRHMTFSNNAKVIFGMSSDNIDQLTALIHPADVGRLQSARTRALEEKSGYQEIIRFSRPDNGETIWLDIRGKVRCDASGKPSFVRGVSVDITERMRAEEELRDADRRKDEFLAMLAHELRNPMAPISAAAELMKLVGLDETRLQQTSDIIMRQIKHMTSLVDDLIDVSRVTSGLITTDKKPLDVKRIVADAVEQVGPLVEKKRHSLQVHLSAEPARITGDQKRLVQVLTNLLNNAAKYTPEGGTILLQMDVESDAVSICVSDNGIGIAPGLLPRVFDLFTQAERTSDRSQGGLGVGLALVKSLVELHGGQVSVVSDGVNKGSRFTVRLPRLLDSPQRVEHLQGDTPMQKAVKALRLLVVDDNVDAANMLAMFLESAGHEVYVEHSAQRALERLKTERPDACLLDIGLPEMDGNELARILRSRPDTADLLLIAITGYSQDQDRKTMLDSGFDHHLIKPVDTQRLAGVLAGLK